MDEQNQPAGVENTNDTSPDASTLLTSDQEGGQTDDNNTDQKEEVEQKELAPEKYEFKDIEGAPIDAKVLDVFSLSAKELNLTQEKAQSILDKVAPVMAQRQQEQIKAVQEQWTNESKTDSEFGGDKLNESLAVAKPAFDKFAPDGFKKLMTETGLGNHPEVIRTFYRIGKAMSEDSFVGGKAVSSELSPTEILYPDMKGK